MRTACSLCLVVVAGVACAGPSAFPVTTATVSPSAAVATSAAASTTPTGVAAATPASSPILRFALTDVRTGERFTLGGFSGKTVIVQGMAVW
jgi:hypothetical protein